MRGLLCSVRDIMQGRAGEREDSGLIEEAIDGAPDAEAASVEDVEVEGGGLDVFVAEEFLDGADVVAVFEEVGGE